MNNIYENKKEFISDIKRYGGSITMVVYADGDYDFVTDSGGIKTLRFTGLLNYKGLIIDFGGFEQHLSGAARELNKNYQSLIIDAAETIRRSIEKEIDNHDFKTHKELYWMNLY